IHEDDRRSSQLWKRKKNRRGKINQTARELRKNQTESEGLLWEILRGRRLSGKKFLRQHPIIYTVYQRPYYFIVDFYCAEAKLVIEIDGSIHDTSVEYDQQRTEILKSKGLHVLRISNDELLDIEKVIDKITAYL
ncbi:MAG: endonuclease domain-containing protein, partial [Bacteroidales bacterium]